MSEPQDWSIKFDVFLKKSLLFRMRIHWETVSDAWHLQMRGDLIKNSNVLHDLLLLLQDAAAFPEPESRIRQYVYLLRWWVFPVHVETSFLLKMCVRSRENKAQLNICNHGSKVKTQQGYHVFLPSTSQEWLEKLNAHILAKGFIDWSECPSNHLGSQPCALIHQWPLQLRSLDSVAFFGAEAKGSDDEQAAFPPGGALADAVLVAYPAAAQEQHMVCVAQPLVAHLLPPKDCKRKGKKKGCHPWLQLSFVYYQKKRIDS